MMTSTYNDERPAVGPGAVTTPAGQGHHATP